MSLFIGRLGPEVRQRDLEDVFGRYGRMSRCELKSGGFGFVDFEDKRDAEDALRNEDGRSIGQSRMVVQLARGPSRRADSGECFRCGKPGHIARECLNAPSGGYGRGGRRSPSPYRRRRSPSPRGRSRSRSPARRGGRSRSRSPPRNRSRSPPPASRRSPSRSPPRRSPPRSPTPP